MAEPEGRGPEIGCFACMRPKAKRESCSESVSVARATSPLFQDGMSAETDRPARSTRSHSRTRERPQIARQCRRIARDIGDCLRRDPILPAVLLSPGPVPVRGGSTTIRSGCCAFWRRRKLSVSDWIASASRPTQICLQALPSTARRRFDRNHALKTRRKLAREKADAGIEIPRKLPFAIQPSTRSTQSIHQPAIHLKESAVIDAIIKACGVIGERICAPAIHGARPIVVRVPTGRAPLRRAPGTCPAQARAKSSKDSLAGLIDKNARHAGPIRRRYTKELISVGPQVSAQLCAITCANAVAAFSNIGAAIGHSLMGMTACERRPR